MTVGKTRKTPSHSETFSRGLGTGADLPTVRCMARSPDMRGCYRAATNQCQLSRTLFGCGLWIDLLAVELMRLGGENSVDIGRVGERDEAEAPADWPSAERGQVAEAVTMAVGGEFH